MLVHVYEQAGTLYHPGQSNEHPVKDMMGKQGMEWLVIVATQTGKGRVGMGPPCTDTSLSCLVEGGLFAAVPEHLQSP